MSLAVYTEQNSKQNKTLHANFITVHFNFHCEVQCSVFCVLPLIAPPLVFYLLLSLFLLLSPFLLFFFLTTTPLPPSHLFHHLSIPPLPPPPPVPLLLLLFYLSLFSLIVSHVSHSVERNQLKCNTCVKLKKRRSKEKRRKEGIKGEYNKPHKHVMFS